jgi:hypothetical protein
VSTRTNRLSTALVHQMAIVRDMQDALRRGDDTDALVARDRGAYWAAERGDADALAVALQNGIEMGPAADALCMAACLADPECVRLILDVWGDRFYVPHIDRAIEYAAQRGHAETLAALLPYWAVNEQRRADVARWTHDEACASLLRGTGGTVNV